MDVVMDAAMTKLLATENYCRVADRALQIFGGMGFMKGLPIERIYRDARITRIYEGTSEVQRMLIASQLLKKGYGKSSEVAACHERLRPGGKGG